MKNCKSFVAGMIAMLLIVAMCGPVAAKTGKETKELEYRDIKVSLDGEVLNLKDASGNPVEPFMFGGTNYLPVRALAETLGLNVAWDGSTATVVLTTPETKNPVYITASGKRWHYDPNCNGGTYWEVPYASAVGMGLTPCEKCAGGVEQTVETQKDELLFSKEHVRFYYTGYEKTSDGYKLNLRIENDSDYKISGRVAPDAQVGNKKCDMNLSFEANPGRTADGYITILNGSLEKAGVGVEGFKTVKVAFSIHDTQNLPYELDFQTGFITIKIK